MKTAAENSFRVRAKPTSPCIRCYKKGAVQEIVFVTDPDVVVVVVGVPRLHDKNGGLLVNVQPGEVVVVVYAEVVVTVVV